jgi:DNA-binding beta-propeller fold protein YncE
MNRRIQRFKLDGTYVDEWKYAGTPAGLDFDAAGQLYMSTSFAGQIVKLDSNGRAIAATGQPGKNLGEFGEAHFLTVRPGGETIYVADTMNAVLHTFVRK